MSASAGCWNVLVVTGSAAEEVAEFIILSAKSVCRFMLLEAAHTSDARLQGACDPAVLEVNGLGEFGCKVEPAAYAGRKVTAVRLSWWAKNLDERKSALHELRYSRVGRRARLQGKVETLGPLATLLPAPPSQDVTVGAKTGASGTVTPIPRRDRAQAARTLSGDRKGEGGPEIGCHPPQNVAVGGEPPDGQPNAALPARLRRPRHSAA